MSEEVKSNLGLLSEYDLASLLGVKRETLQVWRSNRIGPDYVKLGKNVFYRSIDIDKWVARNVVITNREMAHDAV
jgi:predicted DNA-binding transcriptional regulator AlpA